MNTGTDMSEQWKLVGDCSICRRKSYCSKPCKVAKVADRVQLQTAVASAMLSKILGHK